MSRPLADPPRGVRQRQRADGSWRIWWEPSAEARRAGMEAVELNPDKLTWSEREAAKLNKRMAKAIGATDAVRGGPRSVSALIALYKKSPTWKKLRPATQKDYGWALAEISAKWGGWPVAAFTPHIVFEWSETLESERGLALTKSLIRKLSILFTYGVRRGWLKSNPCARLGIGSPPPRQRVVGWEELDVLVAAAEAEGLDGLALALLLGMYTGQRQRDLLTLRAGDLRADGVLRFQRSKARDGSPQKDAAVPVHEDVLPRLRARVDGLAPDDAVIAWRGRSYVSPAGDASNFNKHFARARARAARAMPSVADIQFRDLRRSWAWWSREGGSDARDRGDGMGNLVATDARLSQTYNPPSLDGARRAVEAIKRPAPAKRAAGGE